ncbi:hypothetical protein MJN39_24260, partial [Salmonella enterica subsp. enterica serovar Kentucky]|nr:hypothetical protein [Salmonella enterica subsp. enterica serovar Kentucky]
KLMVLLRTFFEVHKGWHIQYNIVSCETLLDAKKHPDQYRDLVQRLTQLNPDIELVSLQQRLKGEALRHAVARADVVLDCTDNMA